MKLKELLKEVIEWSLEDLEYSQQIHRRLEFQETLKLEKKLIPQKKEQFTLKCQKTCLKN